MGRKRTSRAGRRHGWGRLCARKDLEQSILTYGNAIVKSIPLQEPEGD